MPANTAAFLPGTGQRLEVREAPYPTPEKHQIIVQSRALAINPVDWAVQQLGPALFPTLKFPTIIGGDVAGDVVEVGEDVTNFKIGDRVLGYASQAFQSHTAIDDHVASKIPSIVSYEEASVVPLAMLTAMICLFHKDFLAFQYPSVDPEATGKTLLVWGGSTSVGSNVIQAAIAAGYEVITTASPKNFEYTKKLGASQVFDYNSETIQEDLIEALKGKDCAGAVAIASVLPEARQRAATVCMYVVGNSEGRKFVSLTMPPPAETYPGVEAKFAATALDWHTLTGLGSVIFNQWLPQALAEGKFLLAPEPLVVGRGLSSLQEGLDRLKGQGVSAAKIVVSM